MAVVVACSGGLGNQLFQYAAARRLSEAIGWPVLVSTRLCTPSRSRSAFLTARRRLTGLFDDPDRRFARLARCRRFELGGIFERIEIATDAEERGAGRSRASLKRASREGSLPGHRVVLESEEVDRLLSDPTSIDRSVDLLLVGLFQRDRFASTILDELRSTLLERLRDASHTRVGSLLQQRAGEDPHAVGLHVRRGDYLKRAYHHLFPLIPATWYRAAAEVLVEATGARLFVVVSDDPAWCREHLRLPGKTVVASADHPASPLEDLALLASCRHHIIANSTFSWWGARLAQPGGMVVAPSRWFLDRETPRDLFPDSWTLLENPPSRA